MKTLILLGLLVVASIGWLIWEMKHAPEGYQDKNGFHEGKEPEE